MPRRTSVALVLAACGGDAPARDGDTSGMPSSTSGDASTTAPASDDATSSAVDDGESTAAPAESSSEGGGSEDSSTGVEVPDFDTLPWSTGDDIGFGIAYKDSQDPSARNVFIGYAIGAALMGAAAFVAWRHAVDAERRPLEAVAPPLDLAAPGRRAPARDVDRP